MTAVSGFPLNEKELPFLFLAFILRSSTVSFVALLAGELWAKDVDTLGVLDPDEKSAGIPK